MTAHSNPILGSIIAISEKLERSKFTDEVITELQESLAIVSEYLNIDTTETIFFVIMFTLQNRDNRTVNLHQIASFLDYPFLNILEYRCVLDSLEKKNIIYMAERRNLSLRSEKNDYSIYNSVSNSIIDGTPVIIPEKEAYTLESGISEIMFIEGAYREKILDLMEYKREFIFFERKVEHLELFKNILELFPEDIDSRIMLYYFSYTVICGEEYDTSSRYGPNRQSGAFNFLSESSSFRRKRSFKKGNDLLLENKLVEKFYAEIDGPFPAVYVNYRLSDNGINKLFGNSAAEYISPKENESELDEIISAIREFSSVYEETTSIHIKLDSLMKLECQNQKYEYFAQFNTLIPENEYRWIYYDCVSDFIGGHNSELTKTLKDICGHGNRYFSEIRKFIDENHFLVENGFLEVEQNDVVEKTSLTLTDKSIEMLYGENADLYKKKSSNANVIIPEDLKEKTLFYSSELYEQINMVEESLSVNKLEAIQTRLDSKGLPKGVAVILYGAPGTGKTETVYQLAKKTNRKVLHVDISESKSMWFGESEKRIKKIFTDYRSLCKACKHHGENMPILLFNEADALISKRNKLEGGGPRQTENAIQNILLEEMERLDGIMIATTNLCENMDAAFERRFLFKIKYEKPDAEARSKIWKNKLDYISEEDSVALAKQFDFSGGEIDNIVRKGEMDEIITGNQPDYERLVELCNKERLEKAGGSKIGFTC